jgi:hypothetical protein
MSRKKHNFVGAIEQFATLGLLYFVSDMHSGFVKPLGIVLGLLSLFSLGKDYIGSKTLDKKIVDLVLKGTSLEKRNPGFKKFFHNILSEFSIVKILTTRSLVTALCVSLLAFRINKIFFGETLHSGGTRIIFGIITAAVGAITCILYYSSYQNLEKAKSSTS